MQLHELLNAESTRLSDAREEINQLTNARKSGKREGGRVTLNGGGGGEGERGRKELKQKMRGGGGRERKLETRPTCFFHKEALLEMLLYRSF